MAFITRSLSSNSCSCLHSPHSPLLHPVLCCFREIARKYFVVNPMLASPFGWTDSNWNTCALYVISPPPLHCQINPVVIMKHLCMSYYFLFNAKNCLFGQMMDRKPIHVLIKWLMWSRSDHGYGNLVDKCIHVSWTLLTFYNNYHNCG